MFQQDTLDGNEAVARIAHKLNEVIAIYPITPSSPMGEQADMWSAAGTPNLWGTVPLVQEMQSEGGAAGAVHGALQTGALTTTFTASQGLLLMIPNMYKIAGELTSTVFHIAARSLAAQGLSIFGDHSDVMAARAAGWAMLFAASVQEAHDFALIAQAATLKSRVPFLHVMDGFRTSHEVNKISLLSDDDLRALIDDDAVRAHRARALTPERPVMRGTAQNPDVYFQARETVNSYYQRTPAIVTELFEQLAARTGRRYQLFDYSGAPDAERVIVLMGSGAETAEETVRYLSARGEKVGVLKVRLYRPFDSASFVASLPKTVSRIAVLDRTKEPGSAGEPLYQDVVTALSESDRTNKPLVVGGRYGLSSKEFTPAMVIALFEALAAPKPKNHFTLGITDDLSHTSLPFDASLTIESDATRRAIFWGLGSDGTVSANKNSIKIIGETPNYAQGYFVYDSKKSGARTISHLRFGAEPIHSSYLIQQADFIAVHQFGFLDRFDVLAAAMPGATLLLNSPYPADTVWDHLPREVQQTIQAKRLKVYSINAYELASTLGLGNRINTIMQTAFFLLSDILPPAEAIASIKAAIRKTYGKRGEAVLRINDAAVEATPTHLHAVPIPDYLGERTRPPVVSAGAPEFVQRVTARMLADQGDALPVSQLPHDGTYPTATSQWEKRAIAQMVPLWDPEVCIQCGKCVLVCPHAVIRAKLADEAALADAPPGFQHAPARWQGLTDQRYTLQVSMDDCTGCSLCVEACPAKDKRQVGRKAINMSAYLPLREANRRHWDFFLRLADQPKHDGIPLTTVKNVQLLRPLFEFSGACAGCGETPYLKLLSQLYGDRSIIANATGCSSIYGGNLPTTPWAKDAAGRGPAWSNSLFEDNAEFGLGMRLTLDKQREHALELLAALSERLEPDLVTALRQAEQNDEASVAAQRERVSQLKAALAHMHDAKARDLLSLADTLVKKSIWIVGGDGWAYDIGYGGLDHVLASGKDVNILVLDTEVYSNTGGQASKATALGAVAKFAMGGKATPKKDLGRIAMQYGNVYVAQIAMGASDSQTLKAFLEAESFPGPSLIIAYSHCIAHGIDMAKGLTQQRLATDSAYWPLYRYDPRLQAQKKNPFQLDSKPPKIPFKDYALGETRFRMLKQTNPKDAEQRFQQAQDAITARWRTYQRLAQTPPPEEGAT
jgi:pyruvate-ferredoxin/flavodoxin oxidoreductase